MSFSNSRTNKDRRDQSFQRTVDALLNTVPPAPTPEPAAEIETCFDCYGAGEYSRDTDGGGDAVSCATCSGRGYTTVRS